jgi:hypothetical protein
MVGVVAAIFLAVLAQVRVDPFGDPKLAYRKPVVWSSSVVLQLTQKGFPEGRVSTQGSSVSNFAPLYARLATTEPVRKRMRKHGPILGGVKVVSSTDDNRNPLPFVVISSYAFNASNAKLRAKRQADAFISYIADEQRINRVHPGNRVVIEVVRGPAPPFVVVPRKITLSVVVFLAMLVVTGGVILALENARKRERSLKDDTAPAPSPARAPLEAIKDRPAENLTQPREQGTDRRPATAASPSLVTRRAPRRTLRGEQGHNLYREGSDVDSNDDGETAMPDAAHRARRSFGPPHG